MDRRLALTVFGKSVLAIVFAVMCYLGLGMLSGIGQQVTGYRCYSEPVTGSTIEKFFDTAFDRYDEYDAEGKLTASYVYDYDAHTFVYSEALTAKVQESCPALDLEALAKEVPAHLQMQVVYTPNPLVETLVEVVAQVLLLLLLIVLVYDPMWHRGDHDRNKVQFGHMQADLRRGWRVGLAASIPSALVVLGLFVSKLTGLMPRYIFFYRVLTMPFAPINNLLTGGMKWTAQVSGWFLLVAVLCWAVLPVTAAVGYVLGYKRISLTERLVYKKK